MKKDTQCVHSGTYVDPATRGLNTPIYTSSSFEYLDAPENVYPRYFNTPNQKSIIEKLCAGNHVSPENDGCRTRGTRHHRQPAAAVGRH